MVSLSASSIAADLFRQGVALNVRMKETAVGFWKGPYQKRKVQLSRGSNFHVHLVGADGLIAVHRFEKKIRVTSTYHKLKVKNLATVKIIELVGSSTKNWEDAVKNALVEAAKTVKNIKSVYVKSCKAKVENDKIVEYRANVKIAFVVEREK